jgi:hypothetical protein
LPWLEKTEKAGNIFKLLRNQGPPPTIHSYNGVLYAYANSDTPERAESFLSWWNLENRKQQDKNLVYPNTYSYNIVNHDYNGLQTALAGRGTGQGSNYFGRSQE